MKNFCLATLCLLLIVSCKPKTVEEKTDGSITIKGTIENPHDAQGELNVMGFFVEPLYSGNINQDGSFDIVLPDNFDETTQKAFDNYNSQDSAAYELKPNRVLDLFLNLDGLETSGLENTISLAGVYYGFQVFNDGQRNGAIYPTSSEAFMTYILEQQQGEAVTGNYYYFIYATDVTSIKGKTTMPLFLSEENDKSVPDLEEHDIHLKPGWNIAKYEILRTTKTPDGTTIPAHIKKSTVSDLQNTTWFHITGSKSAATVDETAS